MKYWFAKLFKIGLLVNYVNAFKYNFISDYTQLSETLSKKNGTSITKPKCHFCKFLLKISLQYHKNNDYFQHHLSTFS